MFFCPNCNNAYDISKDSLNTKVQSGGSDENDFKNLIKSAIDGESEQIIKRHIEKVNIPLFLKSPVYKKLTSKEKELVFNRVQDTLPNDKKILMKNKSLELSDSNIAHFVCKNCIYNQKIKEGTRIYSKTSDSSTSLTSTENIDMKIYSDILPITRKYLCPNSDCPSHKNISLKEAIIFRSKDSFKTKYICKTCRIYWDI